MNVFLKKKSLKLPLPQNNRWTIKIWGQKILIGIIILLLFIGFLNVFYQQVNNIFYTVTSPLLKLFWKAGDNTSGFFGSFLNAKSLTQENNNLKQENQNLLYQVSILRENIKQDRVIKEVVQNTQKNNFKLILVETIGLDAVSDFILINKGSNDGISENMPVISSQKALYGRVFKVYDDFSKVMLLSNKNSVFDVKIFTANGETPSTVMENSDPTKALVYGAIKGSGNLSVYLDLVSLDAQIKEGDLLVTSGLEGIFPNGLLVGKITAKNQKDLKPFQTAEVQSFFDIKNTENLFIITNYLKK